MGFEKNVSTSDALCNVIDIGNSHLEHLDNCDIVSIDLRRPKDLRLKDFDNFDNDIIIRKPSMYCMSVIALKLLKNLFKL